MFVASTTRDICKYRTSWAPVTRLVIICGNDRTLLATRKLLLERAGYRVHLAPGPDALRDTDGDALVLCYSLTKAEQQQAVALFRSRHPGRPVLLLGEDVREGCHKGLETLTAYPAPVALLDKVRSLLSQSAS